ncbi:ribosome hibernation-promoting factor, HPF/YfiA family [Oleiharenicola sp. Vm1]|uniref:ribosome hibernation-promoting factor, HPF/YfiA family n=1 Tax=Oleiharenicola sp. Vm1 TaxID=3398393 RepID=UPI0039F47201
MNDKIHVRGIHVTLTPALTQAMHEKAERLLRHNSHIVRIRMDLEFSDVKTPEQRFTAKAQVEIDGPDLVASATSEDGYKSVDLLVDKLDKLLRERHAKRVHTRNDDRRQAPDVLHGKA